MSILLQRTRRHFETRNTSSDYPIFPHFFQYILICLNKGPRFNLALDNSRKDIKSLSGYLPTEYLSSRKPHSTFFSNDSKLNLIKKTSEISQIFTKRNNIKLIYLQISLLHYIKINNKMSEFIFYLNSLRNILPYCEKE